MNRRAFLTGLGSLGAGAAIGAALWQRHRVSHRANAASTAPARTVPASPRTGRALVATARRPELFNKDAKPDVRGLRINTDLVHQMVQESLAAALGTKNASDAWKELFSPRDVVGIKINCLGGRMISSHPAIVNGIIQGLRTAGVPDNNIIVWDRFSRELADAGFSVNATGRGVKCFGTDAPGYGYTDEPIQHRSVGSCFSTILASVCSAIVSVPVLKDHDIAGVTLNLKNFFGAIQKPSIYHGNRCDPFIADLYAHPLIKDKVRLTICDALVGVFDRGPGYTEDGSWQYAGIIVSTDPVAIDRVCTQIIETKRRESGKPSLKDAGREPTHIHTAAQLGLGTDDPDKIDVVEA